MIVAAPCLLALLTALSRGAVFLVDWQQRHVAGTASGEDGLATVDAARDLDDAFLELEAPGRVEPRSTCVRVSEPEEGAAEEEGHEEPSGARRAMRMTARGP
jgi:hypothetical protein